METENWIDKWRDKIILIVVIVIAIGGYFYFNPPRNTHEISAIAEIRTIDAVILKVDWTGTYDSKFYFPDEEKVQVESSLKMLAWARLSNLTTKYQAYRIDKMGIDSVRILLNKDAQIQKLNSMNIRIRINNIIFEPRYTNMVFKRDSLFAKIKKDSLALTKMKNQL
jgi:hypothetical protein